VRVTRRERQIISLVGDGLSDEEIGLRLHIGTDAVKTQVRSILERLGLHTRLEILAYVRRNGRFHDA